MYLAISISPKSLFGFSMDKYNIDIETKQHLLRTQDGRLHVGNCKSNVQSLLAIGVRINAAH